MAEVQSAPIDEAKDTLAPRPPFSRTIRVTAGASLLLAGLLNGLPQVVMYLLGERSRGNFSDQVRWATENLGAAQVSQYALVISTLFMTLGLLAVAQVCRWRAPVLTAIGTPLVVWGMWGFHNILMVGYVLTVPAHQILGLDQAIELSDGLGKHLGGFILGIAPHILGSFLGILLLSIAWIRSGFPRTPSILLMGFLIWDFVLAPIGPLESHMLLIVAWGWMGLYLIRMPDSIWRGERPPRGPTPHNGGGPEET